MSNFLTDLQKLKALDGDEFVCLGAAFVLLPMLRIGMRLTSFRAVLGALERSSELPPSAQTLPPDTPLDEGRIARIVRTVNVAANRGPIGANCLPRSLTIWWLLRRRGLDCSLRIGVKPRSAGIQAHAWVEHAGKILNDGADTNQTYAAFERVSVELINFPT